MFRANRRTGSVADAGDDESNGDAVEAPVGPGVEDAVADAEAEAGGPDGGGVVTGVGLVADAQAATSSPATIVVMTRDSEERI